MSPESHPPSTVCSECGTPPGGAVKPTRWIWSQRIAVLIAVMIWMGLLASIALQTTTVTFRYTPAWGHESPCNAVDLWLDEAAQSDDSWWVREVFTRSWAATSPVLADEPLEIAVVGASVTANTTPWAPSSMTMGRVLSSDMTDAEFARVAREDLERAFGAWDTPGQTNIAWRAPVSPSFIGTKTNVPALIGRWESVRITDISVEAYRGREVLWGRPPFMIRDGWVSVRTGDLSASGASRVIEVRTRQVWAAVGLLVGLVLVAWLFAPPIWWRYIRRRRAKAGRCLRCGYPLLEASP